MRSHVTVVLLLFCSSACLAQPWEVGALGGYGWYNGATVTTPEGSTSIGIAPKGGIGAVFGENLYKYIGGEVRWMYIFGQPQIRINGTELSRSGFSNVIHYDFLVHITPAEAKVRPFVAIGGGVRVYSVRRGDFDQPLGFGLLKSRNETEALISAGAGIKYVAAHGVQVRLDFRTYMTPAPADVFRLPGPSITHGWIYNFIPSLGVSYLF